MADLFTPEDVPELDCPACGKVFLLVEGEAECPACGWTPKDGDAPRPRKPKVPEPPAVATASGDLPGKPRNVLVCILLGVVTLGLYFLFWHYAAFEEVRLHTKTRQRVELFWGAIVMNLAGGIWGLVEAGGLRNASADGFQPPAVAIALQAAGAGLFGAYLYIETWHVRAAAKAAGVPSLAWPAGFVLLALLQAAGFAMAGRSSGALTVVTVIVALMAYPFVQTTINDYWRHAQRGPPQATPTAAPA